MGFIINLWLLFVHGLYVKHRQDFIIPYIVVLNLSTTGYSSNCYPNKGYD